MKRKRNLVVNQDVEEISSDNPNHTDYWSFTERYGKRNRSGEAMENPFANPDSLADSPENTLWGKGTTPELIGRFIERFMDSDGNFPVLSKKQNEVLKVYTATGDMNIVCKETRLSRGAVNLYLARISRKFKRLVVSLDL